MNDIFKGIALTFVAAGAGALVAVQATKLFWKKVSYSFGTPKFELSINSNNEAVGVYLQPITIRSKFRTRLTIEGYDGKVFYKNIEIGKASLLPVSVSNEAKATTTIRTEFTPNLGTVIGMSINDYWEVLRIIQYGMTTKGKVFIKVGNSKVAIPINQKVFFT